LAVPQIAIRLPAGVKAKFEAYAEGLGLKASELAKLLIVRELHLKRLLGQAKLGRLPKKPRRASGPRREMAKVTAHVSSLARVAEFDQYAENCGLNRDRTGAWLLESELIERWLEKAMTSPWPIR
jgi:hypothetical protein